MEELSARIRAAREQAGLTQEELAEALEVSRQAVSKWEAGLSRPSTGNLLRLAQALRVDLEALTGGAEETPAEEAPAAGQETPGPSKRWGRWVCAAAAVGLFCAGLLGGALIRSAGSSAGDAQAFQSDPAPLRTEAPQGSAQVSLTSPATVWTETSEPSPDPEEEASLPEAWTLQRRETRAFEGYGSAQIPLDEETLAQGPLFRLQFKENGALLALFRQKSTSTGEGETALYHLIAAYDLGDGVYHTIARIVEDAPDAGSPSATAFEALGAQGYKVTVRMPGLDMPDSFYFALDETGTPKLWFMAPGQSVEADLDGDGEREILRLDGENSAVYDRTAASYTESVWTDPLPEGAVLSWRDTGVEVLLPDGTRAVYGRLWDGRLWWGPAVASAERMTGLDPQVAWTVVSFQTVEILSDGLDPDGSYWGADSPTHRQLAYYGLQTLYDLTGYCPQRCNAVANRFDVSFSLDDNFENRIFFSFSRGPKWGGDPNAVNGLTLCWKGESTPWSPLDPLQAGMPEGDREEMAQWVYDHAPLLYGGKVVSTGAGLGTDVRLFLADGGFYEVSFDEENGLPSRIDGPYPAGFEH